MKPAYAYLLLLAALATAPPWRSAPIRRWKPGPTVVYGETAAGRQWPHQPGRPRRHRQPPGLTLRTPASVTVISREQIEGARRQHPGHRARHPRRGQRLAARHGRRRQLPRLQRQPDLAAVQRHLGAVRRHRRPPHRQLDLRPCRGHRRSIHLPVRRRRRGRRHQLRDQAAGTRYVLRRPLPSRLLQLAAIFRRPEPAAGRRARRPRPLPAAGREHRLQPGLGRRQPFPRQPARALAAIGPGQRRDDLGLRIPRARRSTAPIGAR